MSHKGSHGWQAGRISRGLIIALAVSALAVAAVAAVGTSTGWPQDGDAAGTAAAAQQAATATQQAAAPRELPRAYEYQDFGTEMFVADPPPAASDPWPVPVRMNRLAAERAATTGAMDVTLPDGTRYPVTFERTEAGPGGNWTWIGRVDSTVGELAAVLTYGRDGVFGVLPAPDGRLYQVQTNHGQAYLQPDPGLVPPGIDPATAPPDFKVAPAPRQNGSTQQPADRAVGLPSRGGDAGSAPSGGGMVAAADGEPVTITVLGVYTTNLVQQRGSVSAAETELVSTIAISNQAHLDSATGVHFELLQMMETDYPGGLFNEAALETITNNQMPDGKDVHAARNAVGADLVTLYRPYASGDPTCGIAWLTGGGLNGTNASSDSGFSVVSCGAYTMAHELGHNLGSHHDRETATSDGVLGYGAFEYSFGHRQFSPVSFATIMAYTTGGQPRVGYFSHPGGVECLGVACGVAGVSDNVRSIKQMADTISRFRDPPNTISVLDAKVVEPFLGTATLRFQVRLSTPAPAGGVKFDIATVSGGTATPGIIEGDYTERSVVGQVIPAGQSEWWFDVQVQPDERVEGDETVFVKLSNVTGMAVYDDEAVGLIIDDDPRAVVTGSLVFPEGEPGPYSVFLYATSSFSGSTETVPYEVIDYNDHAFSLRVPKGARLEVSVAFTDQDPWIDAPQDFGIIDGDVERDFVVIRGVRVSGRVKWPEGSSAPTSRMIVWAWNAYQDGWAPGRYVYPPDFTYSFKIRPGVGVGLETQDVPAPYKEQRVELSAYEDVVQDITLAMLPSLTIAHQSVPEGDAGTSRIAYLTARLSEPAPVGGVSFDLATEDGTATGGVDYVPVARSLSIAANGTSVTVPVEIIGDNAPEDDETFRIVARNILRAHMPSPGQVRILDDDEASARVANDFDADGRSDLVWRHAGNGRVVLWGGADYAQARNLVTVRDLGWKIVGTGDFNSDGVADLLWRQTDNGRNTIWRSGDYGAQLAMAAVGNLAWQVAGTGDFDGDGQSDVLWRNGTTGANLIWRGGDSKATMAVTGVTNTDWEIVGTGDFDGDGKSDIVWRNAATGANALWLGGDYGNQQPMVRITDLGWVVVDAGDFNGDGKDDLLWTHKSSGANVVWHSGERADQRSLTRVTNPAWQIVAVGDYDGDGVADIAWRNVANGSNTVWLGGNYADQMRITGVGDPAWQVVP